MSFEKTVAELMNIDFLQCCSSPSETQYQLPPKTGEGTCRIIYFGSSAVMLIFDCAFLENYACCVQDSQLIHISYFKEVHTSQPYRHEDCPLGSDTFCSHLGVCGSFRTVYEERTPVKAVHIFLEPEYYDTYLSGKIPDSGRYLKEAISILDQVDYFPELSFIFQQLYSYQGSGVASMLFYESKLTEILSLVLQKASDCGHTQQHHIKQTDMEAVHQIAEYIRTHAAQEISLDTLAHMAYMSPAKLKYVFKAVFNCSIRDYRIQNRMRIAKELLDHTDLPIADIARHLGYRTSGNFAATFKKYTGSSPLDYRAFTRTFSKSKF